MNHLTSAGRIKSVRLLGALIAGAVLFGCSTSSDGRIADQETGRPSSSAPELSDQKQLLYLRGTRLERLDIETGDQKRVARLPVPDVVASLSTRWIAFIAGAPTAADDFIEAPGLYVRDLAGGDDISMGPGIAPMWNPLDDRVAFLRPVEPRDCEVETCKGAVTVAVARPGDAVRELLPAGRWGLLAWAGDLLLVADGTDLDHTVVVGPGVRTSLAVPPFEIWDASPDGRWLVTVGSEETRVLPLEAGRIAGPGAEVDLGNGALGDGSWAPDSSRLAATLQGGRPTRVVIIDPDDPTAQPVPGSAGAAGQVLWSPSGSALTITRSAHGGRRLEAAYCPVDQGSRCRALFSWIQDVVLLRME